jgi:hypothetical protein
MTREREKQRERALRARSSRRRCGTGKQRPTSTSTWCLGSLLGGKVHVRPARSIFSNALNFCRSAIAPFVRSPWRYCPFHLPGGAPLPLAPPCNRQRPFFVTGDRQGLPLLVCAPHGSTAMLSCRTTPPLDVFHVRPAWSIFSNALNFYRSGTAARPQAGSAGPPGVRNGQYRHGERTKAAIALPLFFANGTLLRCDTARCILGAAGGANKRVHLTAPMRFMPLVIRDPARKTRPRAVD